MNLKCNNKIYIYYIKRSTAYEQYLISIGINDII